MTTQTSDPSDGDFGADDGQGALPFGALPDGDGSTGGGSAKSTSTTSRKKAVRKKTAKKAAAKKVATKKTASKKTASKKAVRKASASSDSEAGPEADEPAPAARKKTVAKKKATRKKAAASAVDPEVTPPLDASADAPVKKTVRKKKVSARRAASEESADANPASSGRTDAGASRDSSEGDSRPPRADARESQDRESQYSESQYSESQYSGGDRDRPNESPRDRSDEPSQRDSRGSSEGGGGFDRDDRDPDGRGPKRKRTRRSRRRRRSEEDGPQGEREPRDRDSNDRDARDNAPADRAPADRAPTDRAPSDSAPSSGGAAPRSDDRGDRPGHESRDEEGRGDRPRRRRRRRGRKGRPEDGADENGQRAGSNSGSNSSGSSAGPIAKEGAPDRKYAQGKSKRDGKGFRKDSGPKQVDRAPKEDRRIDEVEGMFFLEKGQVSVLRHAKNQWLSSKEDIYVPKKLVQQFKLHDGMIVKGPASRGFKNKIQLESVVDIDGHPPAYWKKKPFFKNLTSIDPDFHYAVGDITDEVSMRVLDLIAPIGRGQRGLLVAPPRTGKTTLMRQFAAGIEKGYPDVHLMVLLIDERPEEATEWKRSVERGDVFVSTADETPKNHINLAEVVWRRANRLVEMGEDVVLLMDSITRLARAYNNQAGAGSGRTMSGGLDSRAMERPRKFFGSARNTVEAGSLTILGTTLVETGSRMDQLVFEEFKGTGNMELVLNRKLADRRIFPAIDIEKSGTRKEEKLVGLRRLKLIHVLRRVLSRMHFAEAADLLITKLSDVEKTDDFLDGFTIDKEA